MKIHIIPEADEESDTMSDAMRIAIESFREAMPASAKVIVHEGGHDEYVRRHNPQCGVEVEYYRQGDSARQPSGERAAEDLHIVDDASRL